MFFFFFFFFCATRTFLADFFVGALIHAARILKSFEDAATRVSVSFTDELFQPESLSKTVMRFPNRNRARNVRPNWLVLWGFGWEIPNQCTKRVRESAEGDALGRMNLTLTTHAGPSTGQINQGNFAR